MSRATCAGSVRCGLGPVAVEAPDQLAVAGAHFEDRVRRHGHAEIGEGGVGAECSSRLTASAPIGSDGVSGSGVVMPMPLGGLHDRGAAELGLPSPITTDSCTATVLIECVSAVISGIAPP